VAQPKMPLLAVAGGLPDQRGKEDHRKDDPDGEVDRAVDPPRATQEVTAGRRHAALFPAGRPRSFRGHSGTLAQSTASLVERPLD
jgi:hypothetical protein